MFTTMKTLRKFWWMNDIVTLSRHSEARGTCHDLARRASKEESPLNFKNSWSAKEDTSLRYSSLSMTLLSMFFLFLSVSSFAQNNLDFVSNLPYPDELNDIWGYTDTAGVEYALVGTQVGFSIVSLLDPVNPSELFFIPGDTSIWRDVKTHDQYAYVVNEEAGGLLIVDMTDLPNSVNHQFWTTADTFDYQTAHNIFIDENGIGYLVGGNIKNGGAIMLDLNTADRFNPQLLGFYDERYVHDCFVRGDTLWTAEINDGTVSVVDIADKANPIVLARFETPTDFAHNCWLSDDGDFLATTDEIPGATVAMYDVSDLNNIIETDQYIASPNTDIIPHNTFFVGDYLVNSYYRDGITIVDATRKDILVETGAFDTSPSPAGDGYNGSWGVYPYLSSGLILASDIEEGLFVLNPTYKRAGYLEGNITDSLTGFPLKDIKIELIGTEHQKFSKITGDYGIGTPDSGMYVARFSHPHCETVLVSGIHIIPGQSSVINVKMLCDFPTSIHNQYVEGLLVYPNPMNDMLQITLPEVRETQAVLYDVNGKAIHTFTVAEKENTVMFSQELTPGFYILKLLNNTFQTSIRLLKK